MIDRRWVDPLLLISWLEVEQNEASDEFDRVMQAIEGYPDDAIPDELCDRQAELAEVVALDIPAKIEALRTLSVN